MFITLTVDLFLIIIFIFVSVILVKYCNNTNIPSIVPTIVISMVLFLLTHFFILTDFSYATWLFSSSYLLQFFYVVNTMIGTYIIYKYEVILGIQLDLDLESLGKYATLCTLFVYIMFGLFIYFIKILISRGIGIIKAKGELETL